jgi:hypothetical protein
MSDFTQIVYSKIRKIIPFLTHDISITPYIEQIKLALQDIDFSNHLEEKLNHALNY